MNTEGVVQRVVFPTIEASPELIPVYVRAAESAAAGTSGEFKILDRHGISVSAGSRVSLDTFFNAFPASHWRRWTRVSAVQLKADVEGAGRVDIYRSSGSGRVTHVTSKAFAGSSSLVLDLPLAGAFSDGGFYWFALTAEEDSCLRRAAWCVQEPLEVRPASIGICSYNRPDDCITTLMTLIRDPEAIAHIAQVIVVDQGDKLVEKHPDFAAVADAWGGRLRIVRQGNLGGSGGFSRAMHEVLHDENAGDVILTDDDIFPEPESFFRAVMFASATRGRLIVHGHMLDLWSQARLHNTGDMVDTRVFATRALVTRFEDVDLAHHPISHTPEFSRRLESDFGGWWMCLIPRPVLTTLGLSLPVFIKWDDIEYGLRAKKKGIRTVTLPGVGVWHMPFYVKDVQTDWTAYFEGRNRLITALLYGTVQEFRATVLANLRIVVKNLLSMNYSAVRMNQMAIEDLLRGPDFIADDLPHVVGRVRAERAKFLDAAVLPFVPDDFESSLSRIKIEDLTRPPRGKAGGAKNVLRAFGAALTPKRAAQTADLSGERRPHWAVLARLDKAVVSASDGAGVSVRERDRRTLSTMLAEATRQHVSLMDQAPKLRTTYQEALPRLVSDERWARFFE